MAPNPFEWYYFDIHTDSGYDVVFSLHVKPFMSRFDISIFDFFVYSDNKRIVHHFYSRPRKELLSGQDDFVLKYDAQNYLKKEGRSRILRFKDDKIEFNVRLDSLLQTDKPLEIDLLPEGSGQGSFKWIVYAPVCKASGLLRFEEHQIQLDGRGYHDYNSGSINLKQRLKGWYWGKFFEADTLTILGQITARGGKQKNIVLRTDGKELFQEQDIRIERASGRISAGRFGFNESAKWLLDDIRFYVSPRDSGSAVFIGKIMELLLYFLSRVPGLNFLQRLLTNTRYRRYRVEGKRRSGEPFVSFYEEIEF